MADFITDKELMEYAYKCFNNETGYSLDKARLLFPSYYLKIFTYYIEIANNELVESLRQSAFYIAVSKIRSVVKKYKRELWNIYPRKLFRTGNYTREEADYKSFTLAIINTMQLKSEYDYLVEKYKLYRYKQFKEINELFNNVYNKYKDLIRIIKERRSHE